MLNKKISSIATTGLMTAGMALANVAPAMAQTTYTPVAGTSCNFTKYLIMDEGDTVPNATFKFSIAPGTARSADTADNTVMEVMAGVGTPTIADVVFDDEMSATSVDTQTKLTNTTGDVKRTNQDRTGTAADDVVQLEVGEKYATKQATVDFSNVTFNEPGIYRYVITETADANHAAAGIIHDTDAERILDVYVTDDGNGALVVSSYVLHINDDDVVIDATNMGSKDVATAGAALDDKTDGFTNEYTTKDLKLEKEVTGNQASRDKYFELTATMKAGTVNPNDVFVVSIADDSVSATNDGRADATSGAAKTGGTIAANAGKTNPISVTGQQLLDGQKFYLQHGQSVVIRGLPINAEYTVTENAEDYKSAVKTGDTNTGVIGTVASTGKMATAGFTNTRNGLVPTGVLLTVLPGAIAIAGTAAGIAANRRKDEDLED